MGLKFAKHTSHFLGALNGQRIQHGVRREAEGGRLKLGQAAVTKVAARDGVRSGVEHEKCEATGKRCNSGPVLRHENLPAGE
jgi:hypothetical protein